ncbi:IS66 family insertion sequence element accessory protein TnpB [Bradyrhizobium sp. 30]|uniref:IS1096 element passenger TnpR family protein n=1 Tax=Bradyrhizobium sp. 30 TaxID=2782669 RepID=UPI001FF70656
MPLTLRLDRLHLTLQAAFGWTNSHLFEFLAGDGRWGIPDPGGDFGPQPIDARKTRLSNIVQETGAKTIHYLYDFGDSRDHVIKLEKWFDNSKRSAETHRIVCAESRERRYKSHLQQGCPKWTTIRTSGGGVPCEARRSGEDCRLGGSGLVMYWKRLDGSSFEWPPIVAGVMRMNAAQLSALLAGMDRTRMRAPGIPQPKALANKYKSSLHRGAKHGKFGQ